MTAVPALAKYLRDWRTFPADVALTCRLMGMRGIWEAIAPRTVGRLFGAGHMMIFAQTLEAIPETAPPVGVTIRRIEEGDWSALSAMVMDRTMARFRRLVAGGCHGLVAWRGQKPIGYAWVAERVGPDVTAVFPAILPAHAAYLLDLYVLPEERNSGVGSALSSARLVTARELGFREGWRMISPSNAASLRTLVKSGNGTRIIGELRYLKLLSRIHSRFTPEEAPALAD